MARKLLRAIALDDGATPNGASSFAECCINILQQGCSYPTGVEKRIRKLMEGRTETVCADIIMRMDAPRGGFAKRRKLGPPPPGYKTVKDKDGFPYFVRLEKSQHADGRKRCRSRSPDRNDQRRLYYEDKNPNGYHPYRPRQPTQNYHPYRPRQPTQNYQQRGRRPKRRRTSGPNTNQMGRVGSVSGGALPRFGEIQRQPQRKTNGT